MDTLEILNPDDYLAQEVPRYFTYGINKVGITNILDHWNTPENRYLKILGDDGEFYILKYNPITETWGLVLLDDDAKIVVT